MSSPMWSVLKEVEDPELRVLAAKLPNTILQSHADSTAKKYLGAFCRWKIWASKHKFDILPAEVHHVSLHLQYLADSTNSKSAVEETSNALAWVHGTPRLSSPTSSIFVKATLEGLQRRLARPSIKKTPVTISMLSEIVQDAKKSVSLSDLRLTTACLLAFAGFLRFSELISVRPCDITMLENAIKLHIPRSKTDQLRKGDKVLIAKTGNNTCLVAVLQQYMTAAGIPWEDQRPLFRPICKTKEGEKLRDSGNISYSCLRELFKKTLAQLGYNQVEFGLHSLRAGGATSVANNGVADRLFKCHGCWKSENAKDGYIDDSPELRLGVSQNLGL